MSYDNNGNLTSDGVYTYEYDIENHLLVVKLSGTAIVSYNYNASGRRVSKTVYPTGQVVEYCYDGDQVIAEYDGSGTLLRKYIYGPGVDEPICMIAVDGQMETRYYYHYDGLGSVVALSNFSGTIVERYRYSAFGQTQILSANYQLRTVSLVGNPYMFTGRDYEAQIGLYYYRARFYNPELGRFLQTDPIGYADGLNWYAYCGNNPVNFVDPMGLCGTIGPWNGPSWRQKLDSFLEDTVNWGATKYYAKNAYNTGIGSLHTGLDIVGMAEPSGFLADLANAGIYTLEGDKVNAASSSSSAVPVVGTAAGIVKYGKKVGSYTIDFVSGMKYAGKGPVSRAVQSAKKLCNEFTDMVKKIDWSPAKNNREAFKDEARRLKDIKGPKNNTYNEINSPGKKYIEEDGF